MLALTAKMGQYTPRDELQRQSYFHDALGGMKTPGFDNDMTFELGNYRNVKQIDGMTVDMGFFGDIQTTIAPQELTNLDAYPNFDFQDLSLSSTNNPNGMYMFQDNQQFATDLHNNNSTYQAAIANAPQLASNALIIPDPQDVPQLECSPNTTNLSSNPATPEQALVQELPGEVTGEILLEHLDLQEFSKLEQPNKKPNAKKPAKTTTTRAPTGRGRKRKVREGDDTPVHYKPPGKRGRKARVFKNNAEKLEARGQFLERNRKAASKCREKKKQYTTELQQKYSRLSNINGEMMLELDGLRLELTSFIQLLKQHTANCIEDNNPLPAIQTAEQKLWDVELTLACLAEVREKNQPGKEFDPMDANHGDE